MKKSIFFAITGVLFSVFSFAQTSTETFETETQGSTQFTDNGVVFKIISHVTTFIIQAQYPGTGWNGTANDNRYIDNSGSTNLNASFSIKTTSNLFKVNRFWVFLSDSSLNQTVSGTLTVTGKLSGVTKFTQTKTSGFATSIGSTNGHTLIDLTNLNGNNYSNIVIDEIQLTLGGAYRYMDLDAFTWVKDSNVVLATEDAKNSEKKSISVYPNPFTDIVKISDTKGIKTIIINDMSGRQIETTKTANELNLSKLSKGMYIISFVTEDGKVLSHKVIKR